MPGKMAGPSPLPLFGVPGGDGSRPLRRPVLSKRGKNAKSALARGSYGESRPRSVSISPLRENQS
jgi:hypothetical protein